MPETCHVVKPKSKEEVNDEDDDICINDTRLPLQCPLSLARIKTPAKGKNCSHQKCFDLEVILLLYLLCIYLIYYRFMFHSVFKVVFGNVLFVTKHVSIKI